MMLFSSERLCCAFCTRTHPENSTQSTQSPHSIEARDCVRGVFAHGACEQRRIEDRNRLGRRSLRQGAGLSWSVPTRSTAATDSGAVSGRDRGHGVGVRRPACSVSDHRDRRRGWRFVGARLDAARKRAGIVVPEASEAELARWSGHADTNRGKRGRFA